MIDGARPPGPRTKEQLQADFSDPEERYHPVSPLGEGSYSHVMSCFDTRLNRRVAKKTLVKDHRDPVVLETFVREAMLLGYLEHPGVASVHDVFLDTLGRLSYTMNVIEGTSVSEVMDDATAKKIPIPPGRCLRILARIAETMAYAHDQGVIHLDLKGENVMLGRYGEVLIVDWGAARLFDTSSYEKFLKLLGESHRLREITDYQTDLVGTVPYMSPEQTTGSREELGPGSDIFSAGVLFYAMLAGEFPFPASDIMTYCQMLQDHQPTPLSKVRHDIPRRLSDICDRMLARNEGERYTSFHEVSQDLDEITDFNEGFPIRSYAPGESIFTQGDQGDHAVRILEGRVEVVAEADGKVQPLSVRGPGEIIGELAIFTGGKRTASVMALEQTRVSFLHRDEIAEELAKVNPWVSGMLDGLSRSFVQLLGDYLEASSAEPSEDAP